MLFEDQATPGACDLAVTRFLRILPAEAMIKGQSRGIVGRHLERGRLPTSRQPPGSAVPAPAPDHASRPTRRDDARSSHPPRWKPGIQIISATLMDEWREVANC